MSAIYTIRPMLRSEVDLAVEWAAAEGWNPGLHDADCFYAADPNGFLIGLLGNEAIATLSAIRYDDTFGFLGFYIVKPEFRGRGYGLQLWNAGMTYLRGCTIGLDGVVAQQPNYQKSGFQLAYRNIRYQGLSGFAAEPTPVMPKAAIAPLSTIPFEAIAAYDRPFFPSDRAAFLYCWLHRADSVALGLRHNNQLAGYGVIRPCRQGYKIGPLFADTADFAEQLLRALTASVPPHRPVYLDVPEGNAAAIAIAQRYAMQPMFETARMYAGPSPSLPVERLFGVTSFELG